MKQAARFCTLLVILFIAGQQAARAVAPYRAPEDETPSMAARGHFAACRDGARQVLAEKARALAQKSGHQIIFDRGRIESESYVQRGEAEYFRFLLRVGDNEVFIICDGRNGIIERQIDLWKDL